MGIISIYQQVSMRPFAKQPHVPKPIEEVAAGKPILSDAKVITLAEYDLDTKDAITAHRIKDYRRKRFNLLLLPKINVTFDRVLEGSDYWNELLHYEST